jgi:transcriptional regulator with XRE-family HTH domain
MNINKRTMRYLESLTGEKLTFSGLIHAIRLGEEMTQVEFAQSLGVSRQYLCDLEHGRRNVSPETAAGYAEILGYSKEQFVRLCLQEMMDKAGLHLEVSIKRAA